MGRGALCIFDLGNCFVGFASATKPSTCPWPWGGGGLDPFSSIRWAQGKPSGVRILCIDLGTVLIWGPFGGHHVGGYSCPTTAVERRTLSRQSTWQVVSNHSLAFNPLTMVSNPW